MIHCLLFSLSQSYQSCIKLLLMLTQHFLLMTGLHWNALKWPELWNNHRKSCVFHRKGWCCLLCFTTSGHFCLQVRFKYWTEEWNKEEQLQCAVGWEAPPPTPQNANKSFFCILLFCKDMLWGMQVEVTHCMMGKGWLLTVSLIKTTCVCLAIVTTGETKNKG